MEKDKGLDHSTHILSLDVSRERILWIFAIAIFHPLAYIRAAMIPRIVPLSAVLVALLSIAAYLTFQYEPAYIFTPEEMKEIALRAIAEGAESGGLNATVASVVRQLNELHPKHILENPPWMFSNAGGAMGAMLVLHCSFIEYVIVFGTALGTEGHT